MTKPVGLPLRCVRKFRLSPDSHESYFPTMRVFILSAAKPFWVLVFCLLALPIALLGRASAELDDSQAQLNALESHLLGRVYSQDSPPVRIERLENWVLGESKHTGDVSERSEMLYQRVLGTPNRHASQPVQAPQEPQDPTSGFAPLVDERPPSMMNTPSHAPTANGTKRNTPAGRITPPKYQVDAYPKVDRIEQQLFGHPFSTEPIQLRLARVEQRLFRTEFNKTNLSDRMEQIEVRLLNLGVNLDDDPTTSASPSAPPTPRLSLPPDPVFQPHSMDYWENR